MHVDRAFVLVAGQHSQAPSYLLSSDAGLCAQDFNARPNAASERITSPNSILTGSKRHTLRDSRRLDTKDAELNQGSAAAKVQAARDIHGHHAHAYRQDHEGLECMSTCSVRSLLCLFTLVTYLFFT
jgi:hypothetical protein